jgi:hypothetical protein
MRAIKALLAAALVGSTLGACASPYDTYSGGSYYGSRYGSYGSPYSYYAPAYYGPQYGYYSSPGAPHMTITASF